MKKTILITVITFFIQLINASAQDRISLPPVDSIRSMLDKMDVPGVEALIN
jgi:hypothetical protein